MTLYDANFRFPCLGSRVQLSYDNRPSMLHPANVRLPYLQSPRVFVLVSSFSWCRMRDRWAEHDRCLYDTLLFVSLDFLRARVSYCRCTHPPLGARFDRTRDRWTEHDRKVKTDSTTTAAPSSSSSASPSPAVSPAATASHPIPAPSPTAPAQGATTSWWSEARAAAGARDLDFGLRPHRESSMSYY